MAFNEIKSRLQKPPVLSMPVRKGRFLLYSDTSKHATGSALYQVQDGRSRLIAYAGKRMPEAAKNYAITELEMCGLDYKYHEFFTCFKKSGLCIAIVDHLASMHIIKSKTETYYK